MPASSGPRFRLQLVLAYAAGLVPGMAFMLLTPTGAHVRFWALVVGAAFGLTFWWTTRGGLRKLMHGQEHVELLLFILLPYQVWTGYTALSFVNRGLDDSPPVEHVLTVLEHERRHKGNDKLVLTHWRRGESPFQVDGYFDAGTKVRALAHAGRLGFEWVELPLSVVSEPTP